VAVAMGDNSLARDEVLAGNTISWVRALREKLGLPMRLRDAGVKEGDLPLIAKKAFQDASHLGNPRKCSEADLLALARESF
jgi:alcohol dehydrogenase class IV